MDRLRSLPLHQKNGTGDIVLVVHDLVDSCDVDHCDFAAFEYINLPEDRWEPTGETFKSLDDALGAPKQIMGLPLPNGLVKM